MLSHRVYCSPKFHNQPVLIKEIRVALYVFFHCLCLSRTGELGFRRYLILSKSWSIFFVITKINFELKFSFNMMEWSKTPIMLSCFLKALFLKSIGKEKVNCSKEHHLFSTGWINCFPRPNHQLMRACPSNLTTLGAALPQIN